MGKTEIKPEDTRYRFLDCEPGAEVAFNDSRSLVGLTEHGDVRWEALDGDAPTLIKAPRCVRGIGIAWWYADPRIIKIAFDAPHVLYADNGFTLHLTDSRVVIVQDKPSRKGTRITAQIRYPWIQEVRHHPSQGFSDPCQLSFVLSEPFDNRVPLEREVGDFIHEIAFIFPKGTPVHEYAQDVVRRAARHLVVMQGIAETDELLMTQQVALQPGPTKKGKQASFVMHVSCDFPQGFFALGDGVGYPRWITAAERAEKRRALLTGEYDGK